MTAFSRAPQGLKSSLRSSVGRPLWRTRGLLPESGLKLVEPRISKELVAFSVVTTRYLPKSHAQMCQDLWVLHETGCKREGFFVEFGATNGRDLSNSYLLESEFGWRGILAEPNPGWHSELRSNRPNASIDPRAVYPTSGSKLPLVFEDLWEFSSLKEFASDDKYASQREGAGTVEVETVSLEDLLESNGAPKKIDFISLDTEGGELAILEAFDFAKFEVDLICVEHNFSDDREPIHRLLNDAGYQRKFVEFSAFDDWYVREGSGFAGRQS